MSSEVSRPASRPRWSGWRVENGQITLYDAYVDSAAITAAMA
jgi:ketosteroid isomerase-like protein